MEENTVQFQAEEGKIMQIQGDEFISKAPYKSDSFIEVKTDWTTLGDVAKWMAAYSEKDLEQITKENLRTFNENHFSDWNSCLIPNGGLLLMHLCGTGERVNGKDPYGNVRMPADYPYIEIIWDYIEDHWNDKVRVISMYTGRQGLLTITIFDSESGECLFSMSFLEMFGHFRSE